MFLPEQNTKMRQDLIDVRHQTTIQKDVDATETKDAIYLHKPHRINTTCIAIFAAILPGSACFALIVYTFLVTPERMANFTIPDCPNATSLFPPVSYVIGIWEPQRLVWQAILLVHFPFRLMLAYIFYECFGWQPLKNITAISTGVEAICLLAVSIVHINAHFLIHAVIFGLWLLSFFLNMLFQSIMLCKLKTLRRERFHRSFIIKMMLIPISFLASISTAFTYPYATTYCNTTAYTAFCVCEYLIVAFNSFYYSMVAYEFHTEWVELRVGSHRFNQFIPSQNFPRKDQCHSIIDTAPSAIIDKVVISEQ